MKQRAILYYFATVCVVDAELRELTADRPDTTESPVTVDAGMFQIENGIYDWSRNEGKNSHTWMSSNFKYGLTNDSDLQFVIDSFVRDGAEKTEGFGDLTVRYKRNLWGNDDGKTAFGLMPFVKIPAGTAVSNGAWEGGLIVPFSVDTTEDLSLATMAEIDLVDDGSGAHEFEFVHTCSLGFGIWENLGGFVEYVGTAAESAYQASGALGFTQQLGTNMMIDGGCRFGLNDAAEDVGLFAGFTVRF